MACTMTSFAEFSLSRRGLMLGAAALALLPGYAAAQTSTAAPQPDSAEADRIAAEFSKGAEVLTEGLELDLPALGDNPAAVPVGVKVTQPISDSVWCEEIILIAERNPEPLACAFRFTPAAGTAEASVRLRLIESMPVRAMARMSDGRVLSARAEITVAAGGCGL